MIEFLFLLLFCILGVLVGVITGILPGLHVNSIALILLSFSGTIIAALSPLSAYGVSNSFIVLLICGFIVSVSISHAFHDSIPSTFLGAPEEDTALSVLPAHTLLLQGRGYEAVVLSAIGSLGAIIICLLLLYPLRFLIGEPLRMYASLQEIMVWVLIAVVLLMLLTEKAKITDFGGSGKTPYLIGILCATFVFFLSGLFGLVIFNVPLYSPLGLPSSVLFPAFAGLFGLPTLLSSIHAKPVIPPQTITRPSFSKAAKRSSILSILIGSISGLFISIIPGVSSSTGTIFAMNARSKTDNEQTLITLSAVGSASAFAVIVLLFIILRTRSGVTVALNELIPVEEWTSLFIPLSLLYLLIVIFFAGVMSYFLCITLGKIVARRFTALPYTTLIVFALALIVVLVLLFTGIIGIAILAVAACIGLLPVHWGVRRSHCMGVLLLPVILYFL